MLRTETIEASTLGLLRILCGMPELHAFGLVGGTNLALRFGHRISVDLDFFNREAFEPNDIRCELLFQRNQTLIFNIENVRVDFVLYPFQ